MHEFRRNPINGRWVIIASDRASRPQPQPHPCLQPSSGPCPFCNGAEGETPLSVLSFRPEGLSPDEPGWWVRVVPNKFPALHEQPDHHESLSGLHDSMPGFGFHEVLVESPHHLQTFDQLPINQVEEILWAIKSRFDHYAEQPDIQTGVMFKNHGRDAGASQAHPHCQLLALPVIPVVLQEELDGWQKHFTDTGNCVFCELLEQELEEKVRIVYENDAFVVLCPYASRFAYETWILPKDHHAHFGPENSAGNLSFRNLAEVIQVTVQKVRRGLGDPSFNIVLHTAPFNHPDDKFHWYLEVLPVTQRIAGFEWGTGCHINPVPSEEAATFLRTVPYQIVPPRQLPHVTPDQALQDTEIDQTDETLSSGLAKKDLLEA